MTVGPQPRTTDVVVVGGGASGLYAAARLAAAGRSVIVIEASELWGGSTATDTGQFWLPATHLADKSGGPDAPSVALDYLNAILGPESAASSAQRRRAFVETTDAVARWLEEQRVPLSIVRGRIDFHQQATGARRHGRVVATAPFDRRQLGRLRRSLRESDYHLEIAPRSARGVLAAVSALASRVLSPTRDLVGGGAALAGRLLLLATKAGVELWPSASLDSLMEADGRVVGVKVTRDSGTTEVRARRGVILACGGFEGNGDWRREHLPLPTDPTWTSGLLSNTGVGIAAAKAVGAQTAEMGEAWWTIVARFGDRTYRMTSERAAPHGIIVDRAGDRFFDEAGPAPEAGKALYARTRRVRAVPSYLIVDDRHRQRYRMGPWLPGSAPAADNESIVRAQSLADLAVQLKIDQAGLIGTVVRFNGLAAKGRDGDFGRGASPVDRVHGDPLYRKNPCLGTLEKSPYWAVPVYPGDAGTKGGVVVDADARVLDAADRPIGGLYAVAGTAATLFADTAPGPGAALASALVDAHRAVAHLVADEPAAS